MNDYPNIIVIVLDTLRKDVLPAYGGKAITPNLDKFAEDSMVFQNAIAPASWTVPSHVSLFSGAYPKEHKIDDSILPFINIGQQPIFKKLKELKRVGIIERLSRIGYSTIGLSTNGWISPGTPFQRYFKSFSFFPQDPEWGDVSDVLNEGKKFGKSKYEIVRNLLFQRKYKQILRLYRAYAEEKKYLHNYMLNKGGDSLVDHITNSHFSRPFFLFVNFTQVHEPISDWQLRINHNYYSNKDLLNLSQIPERLINATRKDYSKEVNMLDIQVGRLLVELKRNGAYDDSLIIITADHGEALKESKEFPFYGHGTFLYDEIVEIPLIVKLPKNEKIATNEGYQSLTKIYSFIVNVIDENYEDVITEHAAFSEVLPYERDPVDDIKSVKALERADSNLIKKIFYPKKAAYKNGYKLVVNGTDGSVDEFTYKGKPLSFEENRTAAGELLDELENFAGNENFVANKKR